MDWIFERLPFSPLRSLHPHHPVPLRHRKSLVSGTACLPGVQLGDYLERSGWMCFAYKPWKGFHSDQRLNKIFRQTLLSLLQLLQKNQVRQARRQVNRRLIENLAKSKKKASDLLHPVTITFSNSPSSTDTILDIRSTDTPAFLYTFANALAMRGIYLVKAKIEVKDAQVFNRFYVHGRDGGKIQSKHAQQELRTAAVLLKEFTHYSKLGPGPRKSPRPF